MPSSSLSLLKLKHHINSPFEKSIIERTVLYIKDRIENFDYFSCKKNKCKINHIRQWINLFIDQHNKEITLRAYPKIR